MIKNKVSVNRGAWAMKTIRVIIFNVLSISLVAMAEDKKAALTFLDTLNKGKELSISDADYAPQTTAAAKPPVAPADTVTTTAKPAPKTEAGVVVSYFRIQVLASTHQEQVKREKNTLTSKIDIPVSITFETPYYKLFAGEFTQRSEAENYLAQVKKLGYNDAWISRIAAAQK